MAAALPTTVQPATPYQFFLVARCGHILTRGADGVYCMEANPERTDYTPGGIGHIPYADEDAAEAFEAGCLPEHGPRVETRDERWMRLNPGFTPTACYSCGDVGCRSRFDCSRK